MTTPPPQLFEAGTSRTVSSTQPLVAGVLDNVSGHVTERRAQRPCVTITRFVDRQFV